MTDALKAAPQPGEALQRLEEVFRALADRTRLRILGLLSGGEVCVCEYLRNTGLVTARKEGLWVHYSLAKPDDAVVQAVLDSAAHWVHHAPSAERDAARLEKRTGARLRTGLKLKVLGCCGK
jgi:ArsR family transcriptional regulator